jgi:Response regulator containing a CheY-like receiver domain and a GGDEF domain
VLLLDTHLDEARSIMERLRAAVALDEQMVEQGWPVTFSCGLTPIRTITEFDDAAKNGGRNRVNAAD